MSSFVVSEALAVGVKEGLKIGLLWLVFRSFLVLHTSEHLRKVFCSGVFISFVAAASLFFFPHEPALRDHISNGIHLSFVVFLLASVGALLNSSGIALFAPFQGISGNKVFVQGAVLIASVFFFLPDHAGTVLFLRGLGVLKENAFGTYASAAVGMAVAGGAALVVVRYANARIVGSFFDIPQVILFFAIVKLLGGGGQGFAEITLIPSFQRGLMKFSHDVIHQTFVFLMVPDHPLLKTTVWNFIGFFFGSNIALWESLFLLLFFPLLFICYSLTRPVPAEGTDTGAKRRMFKHHILSDRRRKALPVIGFVVIIMVIWFSQGGESVSQLYVPKPKPVVEDKGLVMIPVTDPTMNLRDGALHKFVLSHQEKEIRLLVIRKPDNSLSVCLDACEICPPEGYGQREEYVICIYCNTPIPVATMGSPGGCNPIPLAASVDDKFIRIELSEIVKKWEYVNSGKSKEEIR